MKEREALKQLLEALDKELPHNMKHIAAGHRFNARTLLAQPEQEPACFVYPEFFGRLKIAGSATAYLTNGKNGEYPDGVERICLFRAPPQRTWVGLTDEDFQMIYDIGRTPAGMMEMVEAKLKEKNT